MPAMHHQPTGILFDLRKFSIHDGPGIRTAVFFKGCPLRCAWCHNPESQSSRAELILHPNRCIACLACAQVCPHGAVQQQDEQLYTDRQKCQVCGECMRACYADGRQIVGRRYTVDEVMAIIERDRAFYTQSGGGVTFTGGEPLQQIAFLKALLQAAKAGGLHTAVDTCGYATWEKLLSITPWVDLFLYDLKLIDDARHRRYTGVSNRRILQNLRRLCAMGKQVIVRIPVIPGVNDDPQNLVAAGQFLSSLPGLQRVDLLAYHPSAEQKYDRLGKPYPLAGLTSPSQECMQDIATLFNQAGLQVVIGG